MDAAVLFAGFLLAACTVVALALSNRSKDRTIERLVLMSKARNAREYGFSRAVERMEAKTVSIPAPVEGNGPFMREPEELPDSETAAMFNRPG